MAKCKTCGAPVNLAPDGDPRYEDPVPVLETKINDLKDLMSEAGLDDWFVQQDPEFEEKWKKALE
jgi:hypothetical protein